MKVKKKTKLYINIAKAKNAFWAMLDFDMVFFILLFAVLHFVVVVVREQKK